MANKKKRKSIKTATQKINEKGFTTSKKILWATYLLFASQIIAACIFSYKMIDTSVFVYSIPATAGLAGATTIFYLNKSKMENVFKFKISFLEYKIKMVNKYPCNKDIIESELESIESSLDSKVDSTISEAVDENIDIQSY